MLRWLGEGSMGVVYEVYDAQRDCRMALKTPLEPKPELIRHLRDEFHVLQAIQHTNVVRLGDLIESDGRLLFTMELIEGSSFIHYVRGPCEGLDASAADRVDVPHVLPKSGVDEPRLRLVLRQLAEGLTAIHEVGKVHRDIKPSNVLVTHAGRVVVLDFGLVSDADVAKSVDAPMPVGTAAYMAPEQVSSEILGPEADWYSVGTILYEALTGRIPYSGPLYQIMRDKLVFKPAPPSAVVSGVPEDLELLCMELLNIDPESRPSGREILRRLEVPKDGTAPKGKGTAHAPVFVGRDAELTELERAFETTRRGEAVALLIEGESGLGKTALGRQFIERRHASEAPVLVFSGRYYEREAYSYKAMAIVMDELSRWLTKIPDADVDAYLPRGVSLLAEVFPALRRVKRIVDTPARAVIAPDPQDDRTRLFAAVREMLARVADRHPTIIVVDDLQWADADSLALLSEILRPPGAPPLLFIGMLRTQPLSEPASLAERSLSLPHVKRLRLDRLSPHESRNLAQRLSEGSSEKAVRIAHAVAAQSDGHPLFIHELVRYAGSHEEDSAPNLRLDDVLVSRARQIGAEAHRILQLIAIAGRPITQRVLCSAAMMMPRTFRRHLKALCESHLAYAGQVTEEVGVYHNRVRDAVLASMTPVEQQEAHRSLAIALDSLPNKDPEHLAMHWLGAGDEERAAVYTLRAATIADTSLAFDHAAQLYQTVLRLRKRTDEPSVDVEVKLADALANAGRGAEAGERFLDASERAAPGEKAALRRRAASEFLRSGHIDRGLLILDEVLAEVGMTYPRSSWRSLIELVLRRAWLRIRGFGFRMRSERDIPISELNRIDVCWSIASTLSVVDSVRGALFNARTLTLALRAGEPNRLVGPLAWQGAYEGTRGLRSSKRTDFVFRAALALAQQTNHPKALASVLGAQGMAEYLRGQFQVGLEHVCEAETLFREQCTGVSWELATVRRYMCFSLMYLGRLVDVSRSVPQYLAEANARGDWHGATSLCLGKLNATWLIGDKPDEATSVAQDAASRWSQRAFTLQHWYGVHARAQTDLYLGQGREAYAHVLQEWPAFVRSLLILIHLTRVEAWVLRASCALASATETRGTDRSDLLQEARYYGRRTRRENVPWSTPLADLILAGTDAAYERSDLAIERLKAATAGFEAVNMMLYAAVTRRRLGEILGGQQGTSLVEEASAWMTGQGIKNPARWTSMLAPGFGKA